jgi:hypothetical protein
LSRVSCTASFMASYIAIAASHVQAQFAKRPI